MRDTTERNNSLAAELRSVAAARLQVEERAQSAGRQASDLATALQVHCTFKGICSAFTQQLDQNCCTPPCDWAMEDMAGFSADSYEQHTLTQLRNSA